MDYQQIKACLNLRAVLRNLETLVVCDPESEALVRDWNVSLEFKVFRGPSLFLEFKDGACQAGEVGKGKPDIRLFFFSFAHLNRMMDGKGNPIPLKGFSRLSFLTKEFPKLTDRLEYFLKPDAARLADPSFREINTRLNLSVATHAVCQLAEMDPMGKLNAAAIPDGSLAIQVLPNGPVVGLKKESGELSVAEVTPEKASAILRFSSIDAACDLVNGQSDAFVALTRGDIAMRGRIPMVEAVNLMMDRIPHYLS